MIRMRRGLDGFSPYVPGEQAAGDLIKLNTNESPYPPSPHVMEALRDYPAERLRRYPDPSAGEAASAAAAAWGLERENIACGNGSDEVLRMIFTAFVDPGEKTAFAPPTYSLYPVLSRIAGARIMEVQRDRPEVLPRAALAGAAARLTIVSNPDTPLGTWTDTAQLADLAASLLPSGGILVVDEAYADFAGKTAMGLIDEHENLVVTRTLSKSFGLAGLRLGFAVASPGIIEAISAVKDSYNIDSLAIALGTRALHDITYMRKLTARIVESRNELTEGLRNLGFTVFESAANFIFASHPSLKGAAIHRLLRERGILVRYIEAPGLPDGVRISIGTGEEMRLLLEAMKTISEEDHA